MGQRRPGSLASLFLTSAVGLSPLNQASWTLQASQRIPLGWGGGSAATCVPKGAGRLECPWKLVTVSKHLVTGQEDRASPSPSAPAQGSEWEKPWTAGFCAHYI